MTESLNVARMSEEEKVKLGDEMMTPGEKEMSETREKLIERNYEDGLNDQIDNLKKLITESESPEDQEFFREFYRVCNLIKESAQNREEILIPYIDRGSQSFFWHWIGSVALSFDWASLHKLGNIARTFSNNEMGVRWSTDGIKVEKLKPVEPGRPAIF